jgi:hypothetical protein
MKYNRTYEYTISLKFIIYDINGVVMIRAVQQFSSDQRAQTTSAPLISYIISFIDFV